MQATLLAAALAFVTVWQNPQTDEPTYIGWCRKSGDCEATMTWVAHNIERAASQQNIDPWVVMALAMTESRLDPRAKSKKVGAFGLLQLNPRVGMGARAKRECRLQKMSRKECDAHTLDLAVEMFKGVLDECGSLPRAFYAWRTGECGRGPYSNRTYRLYMQLKQRYDSHIIDEMWSSAQRYALNTRYDVARQICVNTDA